MKINEDLFRLCFGYEIKDGEEKDLFIWVILAYLLIIRHVFGDEHSPSG
jgi:hypothetical protein